ncbi:MAG: IS66 family transposase [Sedimentisphaerales bacterium]|nr:IS66 family transposase [Sedimentisphaerales bacterium]
MKRPKPLEVDREDIKALRDRAKRGELSVSAKDAELIESLAETVVVLSEAVEKKGTSIRRLLRLLFGSKTESKDRLFGRKRDDDDDPPRGAPAGKSGGEPKPRAKGHGRNGAVAYTGAERVSVKHPDLNAGDPCPDCNRGKLRALDPSPLVHVHAQPPVTATVYECERLRCHTCGKVFTASAPANVAQRKYDRSVGVLIALLKYGSGMPFARLENLERMAGIPLPASVQWEQVAETASPFWPVLDALEISAAQGQVVHNDDTGMKVLELMKQRDQSEAAEGDKQERRGIFTSGIVSQVGSHRVALFRTGHRHAGENLADVLARRAPDAGKPIHMCDALSRNLPKELEVLLANCLGHARREFVDLIEAFPEPCRYVIDQLAEVYKNDAYTQEQNMDPQARLAYHQQYSKKWMDDLETWCHAQLDERLVEPNSSLGKAINYLIRHWDALTLFLEQPGAPLDNNICERALKRAILHRKNSMFYKTQNGARVGDLFMSLIHTCQLNGVNALDYLQTLTEHAGRLAASPKQWLPWTYRDTIAALAHA